MPKHESETKGAEKVPASVRTVRVLLKGDLLLYIDDRPGILTSTSAPPPKPWDEPTLHPVLSGSAYNPSHEGRLRTHLDQGKSFDDYVERLRAAGYQIEEQK